MRVSAWRKRTIPLLAAAVLSASAAFVPSRAADGPNSVADLVAPLLDAVVNISTSQTIPGDADAAPVLPPASPDTSQPFQNYFDQFFGHDDNGEAPGGRPKRVQSLGSGFVIDPAGIIVTNNHVIDGADEIAVNLNDGTKLPATVIGHDDKTDLALLKVRPSKPLTALKFGDSTAMRVGDWVMAIGNPFGLGGTVTVGIVSARNRDINSGPYDDFIQTDAAINRGNSGGPLFDKNGEVIGINTAIISPTGGSIGLGFAIPSEIAVGVLDQLRQYGAPRRGWLGVRIQDVTDDVASDFATPPKGVLVAGVEDASPAQTAGLRAGDIITALDGKAIDALHALPRIVAEEPVGKRVDVQILRDGKPMTVAVTIGPLKEATSAPPSMPEKDKPKTPDKKPPVAGETTQPDELGLALGPLTPEMRTKYGIKPVVAAGVVVTGVESGSPAEDKHLQPGDVISMVGDEAVVSPDDVEQALAGLKKDGRTNARLVVQNAEGNVRWVNLPLVAE